MVIGAQRCGTTSLYNYLIQHPKIIPASSKEIHFFDKFYDLGLSWYQEQFKKNHPNFSSDKLNEFLTGEATPAYLSHPDVPKRVTKILPNIKFVVLLRNPINRAYSHYKLTFRVGIEKLSFSESIKKQSKIINLDIKKIFSDGKFYESNLKAHLYLIKGIYVYHLENWFKFFKKSQFLIIKSEDFFKNPKKFTNDVFTYLGLPEYSINSSTIFNEEMNIPMDKSTQKWLEEFYKPFNKQLFHLLERDFGWNNSN